MLWVLSILDWCWDWDSFLMIFRSTCFPFTEYREYTGFSPITYALVLQHVSRFQHMTYAHVSFVVWWPKFDSWIGSSCWNTGQMLQQCLRTRHCVQLQQGNVFYIPPYSWCCVLVWTLLGITKCNKSRVVVILCVNLLSFVGNVADAHSVRWDCVWRTGTGN